MSACTFFGHGDCPEMKYSNILQAIQNLITEKNISKPITIKLRYIVCWLIYRKETTQFPTAYCQKGLNLSIRATRSLGATGG